MKNKLSVSQKMNDSLQSDIKQFIADKKEALELATKSDVAFRKCAGELQTERIEKDRKSNYIIDLEY